MRIVLKNKLGTELDCKQVFHGQNPKTVLIKMIRELSNLVDGYAFVFEEKD